MDTIYRVERKRDGRKWQVNEYIVYDDGHSRFAQTREELHSERAARVMCDSFNAELSNAEKSNPAGRS